ncbi:hypothetical protein chiPu_0014266 [Chiloscyllium punctatum]|uniref:Uncharacterized protein n=1 Tax=Chiloscyllium punctatum TaxID=137246 RepID=A0A401SZG9_CHIPU|nr:hypothetical protein [Chiloscyllium punctatum]
MRETGPLLRFFHTLGRQDRCSDCACRHGHWTGAAIAPGTRENGPVCDCDWPLGDWAGAVEVLSTRFGRLDRLCGCASQQGDRTGTAVIVPGTGQTGLVLRLCQEEGRLARCHDCEGHKGDWTSAAIVPATRESELVLRL